MKKIILPVFLSLLILTSCGKEKKETVEKATPKKVELTVKAKYKFNDTFKIFYSEAINAPVDIEMNVPVMEDGDFQDIVFTFPIGVYPKSIRLDVGNNQDADIIEIKNIIITHGDYIIDNSDWVNTINWSPNESLLVDAKSPNLYKIVTVNGVKSPVFMSNIVVNEKMNNYFKDK
jgi:hypothetical protein